VVITGESLAERSGRERRLFRQPARLGSVAQEVADVLTHKDYKVIVQDYDIPFAPNSYQDLAGIDDPEECKRRILAAARADRRVLRRRYSPICRRAG